MGSEIKITVRYFASLRERSGVSEENVDFTGGDVRGLYQNLQERYGFKFSPGQMKVSVNDEFVEWSTPLQNGDQIAFIPPVAGG